MGEAINFSDQAIALAQALAEKNASDSKVFKSINEAGLEQFKALPFPTRKTEAWKYTSLFALTQQDYNHPVQNTDVTGVESFEIPELDVHRLVYVNGVYQESLSVIDQESGLSVVRFSDADESQKSIIADKLGQTAETDRNLFTALNNAQVNDGVLIHVAKETQVEKPIQLVNITTQQAQPASAFARHLIVLERHANVKVIEQFISSDDEQNVLLNQTSEAYVADGAKLEHYRVHTEHESSLHFGGMYVDLQRDSQFESYQMLLGGKIKRFDVLVNHNQPGSHCEMKGVYLPKNDQHVDIHSYIEHKAAHCTTDEVYRGIMADNSKAVFNGRIHIHPDAQKTLAELSNKNLLLSDKAQVNTKPELEIYADDVRCAHGATVAQLDETAKFYLRSRGISSKEADIMLSFGFINELIDSMPLEALRVFLRPQLVHQFSEDEALTRHIVSAQGADQ
ncbi:Fe-S cluster assembly protein SufD [Bermanella marisrubri]|uniref:FeS assembly protein SufD n=1 Tax=Bermanella marisrubri TaxID=207949 RepID=Q1N0G8_9GAMM|nr:Fe-S cluster assembly protein SufD [Bermanella marisrubri]EAT11696.1 FeS assembly protein SufD [Oceanobacter sp. RED65] [Bermanella marisrubri]QIZ83269.1 Fe-S cluster assembly protein SufD [Bermanella marisrubri]